MGKHFTAGHSQCRSTNLLVNKTKFVVCKSHVMVARAWIASARAGFSKLKLHRFGMLEYGICILTDMVSSLSHTSIGTRPKFRIFRIIYRIYQVCQKPNSELVEILGIDIPPVPEVALAGITTDSVLLYWKPPENYHSPLKHFVQVNGINGEPAKHT